MVIKAVRVAPSEFVPVDGCRGYECTDDEKPEGKCGIQTHVRITFQEMAAVGAAVEMPGWIDEEGVPAMPLHRQTPKLVDIEEVEG